KEIAFATPAKNRHALTTHAEDCARLRAGGNLQRFVAIKRRHFYISAQCSLGKRDGDGRIQIISLTLELFVLRHMDHDVEIPGWTTKSSRFAFSLQAQSRSRFDAGGNLYFNRLFVLDPTGAATGFARRADDLAHASTRTARS